VLTMMRRQNGYTGVTASSEIQVAGKVHVSPDIGGPALQILIQVVIFDTLFICPSRDRCPRAWEQPEFTRDEFCTWGW
jgi:hypothetical protein